MFRHKTLSHWVGIAVLAVVILTAASTSQPTMAQHATPSALRSAAIWFSPLPNSTILTPRIVERVQRMAERERWELPDEQPLWAFVDGQPLLETRQLDELWYPVDERDSPRRLRTKFRDRGLKHLSRLNPDVDFENLEPGQKILAWSRADELSQSRGKANGGRLLHGEPLPPGKGYRIQSVHYSFATYYTISELVRVFDDFHAQFPDTPDIMVGDLSSRRGRTLRPHRSHQSGRDVDFAYPRHTEPIHYKHLTYIGNKDFHTEKSFWLIKRLLDGGHVEYMFVDRKWQRRLWRHAKKLGATPEWLSAVFEYRSARPGRAIVRYQRGHDDHIHVRFKCQESDTRCF